LESIGLQAVAELGCAKTTFMPTLTRPSSLAVAEKKELPSPYKTRGCRDTTLRSVGPPAKPFTEQAAKMAS
jgi:hypothetical protein